MAQHKVIVIGGGISGLAACAMLIEAGIKEILLLEASNRLGGRIMTIPFQNHYIELGAQWMHGTKGNPVYELAKSLQLTDDRKEKDRSVLYSTQDGKEINEDYVEKILTKIENIFDNLEDLIENELEEDSDQSLGSLIDQNFVKILKKLTINNNENAGLIKSIYRARLNEEKNETACDDLRKLSALGWNEFENLDGDYFAKLKYGYHRVIDHLSSLLPKELIKLNQVVEKIDWTLTHNQITIFDSVENIKKIYESSYVLCTIPLGYLKKSHHDLFFPKLPLHKIKAIENLGFGCVNKIFVVYENPVFKDDNFGGLQILWRDDLNCELVNCDQKWDLQENKFYKCLDNFEILPQMKNILVCFVTGSDAKHIETLEEQCLIDVIFELFYKCFPQLNLPKPKKVIRSNWNSNHFTCGSYTYIKTGSSINDIKSLIQPLSNQVFFAGEATNYRYLGTVHGAYISGRDGANKIIKEIKNL